MNEFEQALCRYIGEENLQKVQKIKIGIAGAGGLGSNCAFNLVRSGFTKLKIIDFDVVECSNLNRQFFFLDQIGMPKVEALKANLQRINPDLKLETLQQMICEENVNELFWDCDVVVEALDGVLYKTMLVEAYFSSRKLLVSASGIAGWGDSDEVRVRKIHDKLYLVGDSVTEAGTDTPPISPKINIVAAKQADIILNWAINNGC